MESRAQFAALIARGENELELDRAALLIAAEEYPNLEVERYLEQMDSIAAAARLAVASADPLTQIMRLSHFLSEELGFTGNTANYHDPRNSFLNEVIERRVGIPITLSVLYIEVARRIGLNLSGVGMPGHFIVKYTDEEQEVFLDPFNGGRLLAAERCREMIEQMYGGAMPFRQEFLHAVTKRQILTRMLQNLKGIYAREQDYAKTLGVIERALALDPESATELRDRGLIYFALERHAQALADLEKYLRRSPLADDAEQVRNRINQLRQRQAQLN